MVVKLLLDCDDVDANSYDDEGLTPLSYAISRGYDVVVELLEENLRSQGRLDKLAGS